MEDTRILCEAGEKGKIVVNKCLDHGIEISTYKLIKLLIMMHGIMLSRYQKPFFSQNVVATQYGPTIKEIDKELVFYALGFKERMCEYICLLENEEKVMDEVIEKYGTVDAFELNERKEFKLINEFCYEEGTLNIIPNELIENVFDYYKFYDIENISQKEETFKRKLKSMYGNDKNS